AKLVSFRKETNGIKCHGVYFYPLSRVPAFASIVTVAGGKCKTSSATEGASFGYKKRQVSFRRKLMVKNCTDAIFNQPPFQSGLGFIR
ncbi:MAG: hypothetical protein II516_08570, partial [Treponema sp.]|nr:hypothetical protein [Treponema sp.]